MNLKPCLNQCQQYKSGKLRRRVVEYFLYGFL
jgi:hypothetical protein